MIEVSEAHLITAEGANKYRNHITACTNTMGYRDKRGKRHTWREGMDEEAAYSRADKHKVHYKYSLHMHRHNHNNSKSSLNDHACVHLLIE